MKKDTIRLWSHLHKSLLLPCIWCLEVKYEKRSEKTNTGPEMDLFGVKLLNLCRCSYVMLALCWASRPQHVLFRGPLGAVGQVDQHLDGLGQPTQPLVLRNELGGTQGILGREEERSEQMQVRYICFWHELATFLSWIFALLLAVCSFNNKDFQQALRHCCVYCRISSNPVSKEVC